MKNIGQEIYNYELIREKAHFPNLEKMKMEYR